MRVIAVIERRDVVEHIFSDLGQFASALASPPPRSLRARVLPLDKRHPPLVPSPPSARSPRPTWRLGAAAPNFQFPIRFRWAGGLLAEAALAEGKHVQFRPPWLFLRGFVPEFAVLRIDTQPIDRADQDYQPDVVVVTDARIPAEVDVTVGLKASGTLLVNTDEPLQVKVNTRVITLALAALAEDHKMDLAVPLAGAAAALSGGVEIGALRAAARARYGKVTPTAIAATVCLCFKGARTSTA